MCFCGILRGEKGYKCYNPQIKKIVVSYDVIFDELSSWYNPKQNVETDEENENEDLTEINLKMKGIAMEMEIRFDNKVQHRQHVLDHLKTQVVNLNQMLGVGKM